MKGRADDGSGTHFKCVCVWGGGCPGNMLSGQHLIACIFVYFSASIYGANIFIYVKETTKFGHQVNI